MTRCPQVMVSVFLPPESPASLLQHWRVADFAWLEFGRKVTKPDRVAAVLQAALLAVILCSAIGDVNKSVRGRRWSARRS